MGARYQHDAAHDLGWLRLAGNWSWCLLVQLRAFDRALLPHRHPLLIEGAPC